MDALVVGYLGLGIISLLIALGMRIAFATALVGIVGIAFLKGWGIAFNVAGYLPHGIVARANCHTQQTYLVKSSA